MRLSAAALMLGPLGLFSGIAGAGALDEAIGQAGPNYRPSNIPEPKFECVGNCSGGTGSSGRAGSSGSVRTPKAPRQKYGYNPSAAVGVAVFGSLLEGILFSDTSPQAPDPETLRRQEEARQQAEAEARRRAEEEQARHQRLLSSLRSLQLPRPYSATPGEQGTTGSGLTALEALDAPVTATAPIAGPLDGELEKLRADASRGWDTADTRFAVRWQPLPLAGPASLPVVQRLCQDGRCAWPEDPGMQVPKIDSAPAARHALDQGAVVKLLRQPGAGSGDPRSALIAGLLARPNNNPGVIGQYVLDERLQKFAKGSGKELLWVFAAQLLESTGTVGKGITLMHDVYELASNDMNDAIKVAGWLGSTTSEPPPSITSPEEAALPYLTKSLGASSALGEKAAEYAAAGIDAGQLASRLLSLWRGGQ